MYKKKTIENSVYKTLNIIKIFNVTSHSEASSKASKKQNKTESIRTELWNIYDTYVW